MADAVNQPTAAELREQAAKLLDAAEAMEKPPATDSRQPGFNPEAEASHAAAAADATAAAKQDAPAAAEAAKPARSAGEVLLDLLTSICDHVGNRPTHVGLLEEYKKALGQ